MLSWVGENVLAGLEKEKKLVDSTYGRLIYNILSSFLQEFYKKC